MALDLQWQKIYTPAQIERMAGDNELAKIAVYIDCGGGSEIAVCTGQEAITHDGHDFEPEDIRFGTRQGGSPTQIIFPNADRHYSILKFTKDTLNDLQAEIHYFLRQSVFDAWTHVHTATVYTHQAQWGWVNFTLTLKSPIDKPKRACLAETKETCNLPFKGELCGYAGADPYCEYTLEHCRDDKENEERFRGAPSCPDPGETFETIIGWITYEMPPLDDRYEEEEPPRVRGPGGSRKTPDPPPRNQKMENPNQSTSQTE
jgi:hypothetical protein